MLRRMAASNKIPHCKKYVTHPQQTATERFTGKTDNCNKVNLTDYHTGQIEIFYVNVIS